MPNKFIHEVDILLKWKHWMVYCKWLVQYDTAENDICVIRHSLRQSKTRWELNVSYSSFDQDVVTETPANIYTGSSSETLLVSCIPFQ